MQNKTKLHYCLALWRTLRIGVPQFKELEQVFPDFETLFKTPAHQLTQLGLTPLLRPDWQGVERDLAWLDSAPHHHIILWDDPFYPPLLKEMTNPPPILFIKGDPKILSEPQIAIVGSRNPTLMGKETAQEFAAELVKAGLNITSGLALGIDGAAHEGTLAAEGKTIAVMGCGLEQIYPKRHQKLAAEIIDKGGAIISEFPIGTPALPENFPQRNRIVSGLSVGTLVIEATLRSGSLITAKFAAEQGREVFAIPGSIHNPLSKGCHALIKQGAKLVENIEDILTELKILLINVCDNLKSLSTPPNSRLDEEHLKLLKCVPFEPTSMDMIIERSGLSVQKVASMLLTLELQSYIAAVPGGYSRVKK